MSIIPAYQKRNTCSKYLAALDNAPIRYLFVGLIRVYSLAYPLQLPKYSPFIA